MTTGKVSDLLTNLSSYTHSIDYDYTNGYMYFPRYNKHDILRYLFFLVIFYYISNYVSIVAMGECYFVLKLFKKSANTIGKKSCEFDFYNHI